MLSIDVLENDNAPNSSSEFGKFAVERLTQFSNADIPIEVTELGR